MRILVACEESQAVTTEMRKRGHEAYSCDIEPCGGGFPEWHLQQDVTPLLKEKWDMIIAFPPCTYLTTAGTRHYSSRCNPPEKIEMRMKSKYAAAEFFMQFVNADCEKIAIENPVGFMSAIYRKPDQIIQPWQFGDTAQKRTCLWLKGLPLLKPTKIVDRGDIYISPSGKKMPLWYTKCGKDRQRIRSKTFPGIARAMAEQWGDEALLRKYEEAQKYGQITFDMLLSV